MKISSKQAGNIVESLRGVIDHDINFIDLNCIIIASSDKKRIGDFHEGSQIVFETKKPLVIHSDEEYEGARAGINYPVTFNDEVVATIGITGNYDEIKKFSSVIVKMTEILIKEFYFRDQRELRQENERYLVELIINNLESPQSIQQKASSLGVKIDNVNRVAIIKLQEKKHKFENMRQLIFNSIKRRLEAEELLVNHQGDYVAFLSQTDINKLKLIKEYVTSKYSIELSVGFSEEIQSIDQIYIQYMNTFRIASLANKTGRYEIVTLGDFDLELILLDLDDSIKSSYLQKVFGNIDNDTLEQWTEMLMAFSWNDGSINATSEELFIHKNTLQYRLKKIKEITGYDPRKLRDFTILYIATLLKN